MPWPLKDGGAIAMFQLSAGLLSENCKLTLAVPLTRKHNPEPDQLPEILRQQCQLYTAKINTDITFAGAFFNLFSGKPYYISRYKSRKFNELLKRILAENKFDFIIFESLKTCPYLDQVRKLTNARILLRSHNVEHQIWERMAENSKGIKRVYLKILASRLLRYELNIINKFDALLPISDADLSFFKSKFLKIPYFTCPTGIEIENYHPSENQYQPEPCTLFHIGALDWMSNLEGLKWFLHEVWPEIIKKFPEVKFYIAGRNTPKEIKNIDLPNVIILGEIEDAKSFIQTKQIMVIPLKSGSGLKIKVIEGLAAGKIIVSTSIGAEGTACSHKENILIANTPQEFVNAVSWVFEFPEKAARLAENARQHVIQNFDNRKIIKNLIGFLHKLTSKQDCE